MNKNATSFREPAWVRLLLIFLAIGFLSLMLLAPLVAVFVKAFEGGVALYWAAIVDPDAMAAIYLTLQTVAIVIPLNAIFGVAVAWAITKFNFVGKSFLLTLIDLPFAVSPVIAGLIFISIFGARGLLGPWLTEHGIQIIFSSPGIIIATAFVTFSFVARELIPLMQSQGTSEEEAALTLGASGWDVFWRVTLPNVKWALIYGVLLTGARAAGEFGAVSVVSGHIRGETNTMPLHIEVLYNEYQFVAAFAVASLLTSMSIVTLVVKHYVEWNTRRTKKSEEQIKDAGGAI